MDIPTLALISGGIAILQAVAFCFAWALNRNAPGLGRWALTSLLSGSSLLLVLCRQLFDSPLLTQWLPTLLACARRKVAITAALGFDGKWVLHPDQVAAANEVFSPRQDDYDHAELILDAYDYFTSAEGGAKGAVMLGDEMIDEASRKMALVVSAKGRAAGMTRTKTFEKPEA